VDKNFADAHYELAKTYLKMGNPMPAYAQLMQTVDLAPSNLAARIDLGNLLLAGGKPDKAEEQAKAVLAANPNYADGYALLAAVANVNHDSAKAMQNLEHALQLDPNKASYHTAKALLVSASPGNDNQVQDELSKAANLDPKSATPHMLLAAVLEKKGDVPGAEREYQAAIAATPKDQQIQERTALAGLYFRSGNKDKAEQTIVQTVEQNPDNADASRVLQEYYARTSQPDRLEPEFASLASKYPKSVPIRLMYARILTDKKDFTKASQIASDLTKTNGGDPEVQVLNAVLMMNTGKADDALALLKKATKDSPNNYQTQLLLGRVANTKGDFAQAQSAFQAAAKLQPASLDAAAGVATVAVENKDSSTLTDVAEKTIQAHPNLVQGYMWRGTAEAMKGSYDRAEADFQTALKYQPNNPSVYLELAEIRKTQGKASEARAMFEKVHQIQPEDPRPIAELMQLDLVAKQPDKAKALVEESIAKYPNNGVFYAQLAQLQLMSRDFNGALQNAQKSMQLTPSYFDAVKLYTEAEVALGQLDPAIGTWQKWVNDHPNDANGNQILATLTDAKGDQAKAKQLYQKTLQLNPDDFVAANNLAYLMIETGDNADVALSLAQTARRLRPDNPETADTLAWAYFTKGNYSQARDLLEDAIKEQPNDASMQYHLGMTYSKLDDKSDAVSHLKKAASIDPNGRSGKSAAAELAKLS
jgi:tetratricopeptide (TPR) repeat protein